MSLKPYKRRSLLDKIEEKAEEAKKAKEARKVELGVKKKK